MKKHMGYCIIAPVPRLRLLRRCLTVNAEPSRLAALLSRYVPVETRSLILAVAPDETRVELAFYEEIAPGYYRLVDRGVYTARVESIARILRASHARIEERLVVDPAVASRPKPDMTYHEEVLVKAASAVAVYTPYPGLVLEKHEAEPFEEIGLPVVTCGDISLVVTGYEAPYATLIDAYNDHMLVGEARECIEAGLNDVYRRLSG